MKRSASVLGAAVLLFLLGVAALGYWPMRQSAAPAAGSAGVASKTASEKARPAVSRTSGSLRKLVVLNSNALEAVHILGAEDRIVGVYSGMEADLWPELAAKPQVGKWSEPNAEAIARLEPDAVIHYGSTAPHLEARLQPLGIQVLRLDFFRIDSLPQEMLQLGQALDKLPQAQRFNAWHHDLVGRVQKQTASVSPRARVYLENYGDYRTAGAGSGMQQLCDMAHGLNVAAELQTTYPGVAPEWVVNQNPDMILKLSGTDGHALQDGRPYDQLRERLVQRPAWKHIKAIQNDRVHVLNHAITSGPRMAVALVYIARWMYPARMRDLDPEEWHRQYMATFLRKPYRGHYASTTR